MSSRDAIVALVPAEVSSPDGYPVNPGHPGHWLLRRRGWLGVALLAVLVLAFRDPVLRFVGGLLVHDDPPGWTRGLVPLRAAGITPEVARRIREGQADRVVLVGEAPGRLERYGVIEARPQAFTRALVRDGVETDAIEVQPARCRTDWDLARALKSWLQDHPGQDLTVLGDRLETRRLRLILDRKLGEDRGRVRVTAIRDPRYDESDWWTCKDGLLGGLAGGLRLAYTWLAGEGKPGDDWDLGTFERGLR